MSAWETVLTKLAPTAATLLGGPFAGLAVSALEGALGTTQPVGTTTTLTDRVSAIQQVLTQGQMTGEQILALKQADLEVQKHLADNGIQLEQISANDRDSARKREIEIKDVTPKVLAYSVTVGFFGTLTALMYGDISGASHEVLLVMIGSLGTAWTGIITYYFGSSAGSAAKTGLLAKAQPIS